MTNAFIDNPQRHFGKGGFLKTFREHEHPHWYDQISQPGILGIPGVRAVSQFLRCFIGSFSPNLKSLQ